MPSLPFLILLKLGWLQWIVLSARWLAQPGRHLPGMCRQLKSSSKPVGTGPSSLEESPADKSEAFFEPFGIQLAVGRQGWEAPMRLAPPHSRGPVRSKLAADGCKADFRTRRPWLEAGRSFVDYLRNAASPTLPRNTGHHCAGKHEREGCRVDS